MHDEIEVHGRTLDLVKIYSKPTGDKVSDSTLRQFGKESLVGNLRTSSDLIHFGLELKRNSLSLTVKEDTSPTSPL